jgi:hypothetical protein
VAPALNNCDIPNHASRPKMPGFEIVIVNRRTGAVLQAQPVLEMLLDLMRNGELYPYLEKQGLIEPFSAG